MARKTTYPDKKTLNLVIKDLPPHYYHVLAASIFLGLLLLGIFVKFAVVDRFSEANRLSVEAVSEQLQYEQLLINNASFWEVRAEYEKYFTKVHTDGGFVDAMETVLLIERTLMENAAVQSAELADNVLSVVLTGINLEQASAIVRELNESEIVSSVSLSSADTTAEDINSSISMSVTLVVPEEET